MHSCTKPITVLFCRGFFFLLFVAVPPLPSSESIFFSLSTVSIILCGLMCTRWYSVTMHCTLAPHTAACLLFFFHEYIVTVTLLCLPQIVPATQNEYFAVYVCVCNFDWKSPPATQHTVTIASIHFMNNIARTNARATNNDNNNTKTITISDFDLLNQSNSNTIKKKIIMDVSVCVCAFSCG